MLLSSETAEALDPAVEFPPLCSPLLEAIDNQGECANNRPPIRTDQQVGAISSDQKGQPNQRATRIGARAPQFSRTVVRPMFGPNRPTENSGLGASSSRLHWSSSSRQAMAVSTTLEPKDVTASTFAISNPVHMRFRHRVVEEEFVVWYLSHRIAAFAYCLLASTFAIVGVLLYVTEYLNAFARSLMLISAFAWGVAGAYMMVLFRQRLRLNSAVPFSRQPSKADDYSPIYMFRPKDETRVALRSNGHLQEIAALVAVAATYLFCIANFAGKGHCKNPLWDADDELRACRAAMQSDSVIIIFMAANTIFLCARSLMFSVVSVALTALYIGMKLSPVMIDVVPEYFWGSFTVIVVELALSIVAVYLREREGRRQFETFVQRHLKAMELSEVHRQTERMIASQIPLAAIRAIQEGGSDARSGGLWAWSNSAVVCVMSTHNFSQFSSLVGPSETVMLLQRLFEAIDEARDKAALMFKEIENESLKDVSFLDKYHTIGDSYLVMSLIKSRDSNGSTASDDLVDVLQLSNNREATALSADRVVIEHTIEFALNCIRRATVVLREVATMFTVCETNRPASSCAKVPTVSGVTTSRRSEENGYSETLGEHQSTRPPSSTDLNSGRITPSISSKQGGVDSTPCTIMLCASVARGIGGGMVFLETKNLVAVGPAVQQANRQLADVTNAAVQCGRTSDDDDSEHSRSVLGGEIAIAHDAAAIVGNTFTTNGPEFFIPIEKGKQSRRLQQQHRVEEPGVLLCRCRVMSCTHNSAPRRSGINLFDPPSSDSISVRPKKVHNGSASGELPYNPFVIPSHQRRESSDKMHRLGPFGETDEGGLCLLHEGAAESVVQVSPDAAALLAADALDDILMKAPSSLNDITDSPEEGPFDVLTRWKLLPWCFRDSKYESSYQRTFATMFTTQDALWAGGAFFLCFCTLFVCCAIDGLWDGSASSPLIWVIVGATLCVCFVGAILLGTHDVASVMFLRIPLMVLHWCATACFVVSVFLAPSHTLMGDSQMVWLFVMFHVSMVRPRWSSYLVMWITDCLLAVAFFVRTLVFFNVGGSVRMLSLFMEVASVVYTLLAWIVLEYSHREAFTNDAHFGFLKARIEEDYKSLEATLVSLLPEGVGGGLVARARARSGWAREVVEVHPLWSTSFGTSTA